MASVGFFVCALEIFNWENATNIKAHLFTRAYSARAEHFFPPTKCFYSIRILFIIFCWIQPIRLRVNLSHIVVIIQLFY